MPRCMLECVARHWHVDLHCLWNIPNLSTCIIKAMEQIKVIARVKIHNGKLAEFKQWASDAITIVRAKDPGTSEYDYYFNADETECVIRETYEDSNAAMAHLGNVGDLLAIGAELGDITIEVYGNPSEELANAAADMNPAVYTFFKGM